MLATHHTNDSTQVTAETRGRVKAPAIVIFSIGLIAGWLILGRVLLPASPSDAEPQRLAIGYQKIYLRLVAESFWLAHDTTLVQRSLGAWDRQEVSERLAQMEAEATDEGTLLRLSALRTALDTPRAPLTLAGFVRAHSTIIATASLPLMLFLGAIGVGVTPFLRGLFDPPGEIEGAVTVVPLSDIDRPSSAQMAGQPVQQTRAADPMVPGAATGAADTRMPADPTAPAALEPQMLPVATPQFAGGLMKEPADAGPQEGGAKRIEQPPAEGPQAASRPPRSPYQASSLDQGESPTPQTGSPARDPQSGQSAHAQSAAEAVAAAINDNEMPGDLGALLAEDVFSQIFDTDILFDPQLKALSDSLEDIDIAQLLYQAHTVAVCLYAKDTVHRPDQGASR